MIDLIRSFLRWIISVDKTDECISVDWSTEFEKTTTVSVLGREVYFHFWSQDYRGKVTVERYLCGFHVWSAWFGGFWQGQHLCGRLWAWRVGYTPGRGCEYFLLWLPVPERLWCLLGSPWNSFRYWRLQRRVRGSQISEQDPYWEPSGIWEDEE